MDRGAWWATVHGSLVGHKESDTTKYSTALNNKSLNKFKMHTTVLKM